MLSNDAPMCDKIKFVYDELQNEITQHKIREDFELYKDKYEPCVGIQNYECRDARDKYYRYLESVRAINGIENLYKKECQKQNVKVSCDDLFFTQKSWDDEIDNFNFFITLSGDKEKYASIMQNTFDIRSHYCPT